MVKYTLKASYRIYIAYFNLLWYIIVLCYDLIYKIFSWISCLIKIFIFFLCLPLSLTLFLFSDSWLNHLYFSHFLLFFQGKLFLCASSTPNLRTHKHIRGRPRKMPLEFAKLGSTNLCSTKLKLILHLGYTYG